MKKIYLTKGLPGSGKSTWAKKLVLDNAGSIKRINKDDIRAMLDAGRFSHENEKFVLMVRDTLINMALTQGKHVIVDDTNLDPKHEQHIREMVKGVAEVVIKDFTDVSVEECIKRDLTRTTSVGEAVIRKMYNQYLRKRELYVENDTSLPHAIIVDLDGTLAHMVSRSPFQWDKVDEDVCDKTIKNIVNHYGNYNGYVIIISGRDGSCLEKTENWLYDNGVKYDFIHLKEEGSFVKDIITKKEIFEKHIRGKFLVDYVLEDRNGVVEMWRDLGLTCLQVADGNF